MIGSSRHRIFKRALVGAGLLVGIPSMLLSLYVGAWLLFTWWVSTGGAIPSGPYRGVSFNNGRLYVMHPAFAPIDDHIAAGRPGSELLLGLRSEATLAPPSSKPAPDPHTPLKEDIDRLLSEFPE